MSKTKIQGERRMPQDYGKPSAEMRGRAKRELERRKRSAPTISRVIRRV